MSLHPIARAHLAPLHLTWFAGGGGSSQGFKQAFGRDPDYALNHNATALLMHEVNHPGTAHLCADAYAASPLELEPHRPIDTMWFSPDCTHHSKARGSAPKSKRIRGLAWCVIPWAKLRKPRHIMIENVEEFRDWGPLLDNGQADPARKGETFALFNRRLEACGYVGEWRELVIADYGGETTRKRLFGQFRCDGRPIRWPERTHAPRHLAEKLGLQPWVGAASFIDFERPCPSIFMTQAEAKAQKLKVKRPLVGATKRRIAKGIERYVIGAAEPFIVALTHHGTERTYPISEPLRTVTCANRGELALAKPEYRAAPIIVGTAFCDNRPGAGLRSWSAQGPLRTITGSPNEALAMPVLKAAPFLFGCGGRRGQSPAIGVDKPAPTMTGKADTWLATPFLTKFRAGSVGASLTEPLPTVTANHFLKKPGGAVPMGVITPFLVPHHGERAGQPPRCLTVTAPCPTVTPARAGGSLVAPVLIRTDMSGAKFSGVADAQTPLRTITGAGGFAMSTAFLTRQFGTSTARSLAEPHPTVMTDGAGGKSGVVAASLDRAFGRTAPASAAEPLKAVSSRPHDSLIAYNLTTYYATGLGSKVGEPIRTVTGEDRHGLVASFLEQANTGMVGRSAEEPLSTIVWAGSTQRLIETRLQAIGAEPGSRRAQVLEFLWEHFGAPTEAEWSAPLATLQARLKFGYVVIADQVWEIADIGMRMLTVRELFRAQTFPAGYIIDRDIRGNPITATAATLMCGNAVPPLIAKLLYAANWPVETPLERVAA